MNEKERIQLATRQRGETISQILDMDGVPPDATTVNALMYMAANLLGSLGASHEEVATIFESYAKDIRRQKGKVT